MLLKDGGGTCCAPFPNLFEINNLDPIASRVLERSQAIRGAALMSLSPIWMCLKNVFNVQNGTITYKWLDNTWRWNAQHRR